MSKPITELVDQANFWFLLCPICEKPMFEYGSYTSKKEAVDISIKRILRRCVECV